MTARADSNRRTHAAIATVAGCLALLAGCGGDDGGNGEPTVQGAEPEVTLPTGEPPKQLVVTDLKEGDGAEAQAGDELVTQFVAVYVTGEKFESSWERDKNPFEFELGGNEANPGWEMGMRGMREGGRRELIVPPELTSRFGAPPETGPEKTLIYVVDLLEVHEGEGAPSAEETLGRGEPSLAPPEGPPPGALVARDMLQGKGRGAAPGDELTVEYVGIRWDGSQFTNSWERSKPFQFTLGGEEIAINPGWERGLRGMREGGRREVVVPPQLLQRGSTIRGSERDEAVLYVIDLVSIDPAAGPSS